MDQEFINVVGENISKEHLCCAISDKKHQKGVKIKKAWLEDRFQEGHTFRKLNAKGKVFIEYAPLDNAWVPIIGDNYIYIYCLWVSGSFKNKGYGRALLEYCLNDARQQGKSGVCILSSKKKKPFLSDKKYLQGFGFEPVDMIGNEYELLALSYDGSKPRFTEHAKEQAIESNTLTIYYGMQCPYIPNCIEQIESYCNSNQIPLDLIPVDSLEKAKSVPCIYNNWAVFYRGKFQTLHLLNEGYLKQMLDENAV